ncbi:MAG: MBL fold metallo-hydrolase [Pseudohongiellaceae bacterium]
MSEFRAGIPFRLEGLRTPIFRILGHNPGPMTGPGTNSYLIGRNRRCLLDPGPDDEQQLESLLAALDGAGLDVILVTHTHRDHSPLAARLARLTGAELVGLPAPDAPGQDPGFRPSKAWRHDDVVEVDGLRLRVIHTPGHVSNHLCYLLEEEKLLFTGDHVLQGTTPVILPPDGDMGHYLDSLTYLQTLDLAWLAPGHGDLMARPQEELAALIAHRRGREEKIVTALNRLGGGTEEELLREVYADVAAHLLPWARKTQLAHLLKLQREGRAALAAGQWRALA